MILERALELIEYVRAQPMPAAPAPIPKPMTPRVEMPTPPRSPVIMRIPTPKIEKYETELDRALKRLHSIVEEISDHDIVTMKELVYHSHIGKVLTALHGMVKKYPTVKKTGKFYDEQNVKRLMRQLDPTKISPKIIERTIQAIKIGPRVEFEGLDKVSHCAALIYKYIKTFININRGIYTDTFEFKDKKPYFPSLSKKFFISCSKPREFRPIFRRIKGTLLPLKQVWFN